MHPIVKRIAAIPIAQWGWGHIAYLSGLLRRETRLNRLYDKCTFRIMASVLGESSNCVDVGCHTGQMLERMLQLAPKGNHLAFEPIPELAAQLRDRFPQVQVFETALSDTDGTATFRHVLSRPAYSGLKERAYPSASEDLQLIDVKTARLDDLLGDDLPIDFMKIDVEGGELQVLRGAEKTIRRNKPFIVFEHGLGAAEYYGTRPESIFELMVDQCEMQISLLPDWLQMKPPLCREDFVAEFDNHTNFYFLAHR